MKIRLRDNPVGKLCVIDSLPSFSGSNPHTETQIVVLQPERLNNGNVTRLNFYAVGGRWWPRG